MKACKHNEYAYHVQVQGDKLTVAQFATRREAMEYAKNLAILYSKPVTGRTLNEVIEVYETRTIKVATVESPC